MTTSKAGTRREFHYLSSYAYNKASQALPVDNFLRVVKNHCQCKCTLSASPSCALIYSVTL